MSAIKTAHKSKYGIIYNGTLIGVYGVEARNAAKLVDDLDDAIQSVCCGEADRPVDIFLYDSVAHDDGSEEEGPWLCVCDSEEPAESAVAAIKLGGHYKAEQNKR